MPGPSVRHSATYIASSYTAYHTASDHKHVTLKIGTPQGLEGELKALRHIRTIKTNHAGHGSLLIRQLLDEFQEWYISLSRAPASRHLRQDIQEDAS